MSILWKRVCQFALRDKALPQHMTGMHMQILRPGRSAFVQKIPPLTLECCRELCFHVVGKDNKHKLYATIPFNMISYCSVLIKTTEQRLWG